MRAARKWVVNASPVILLAKIGRQALLEDLTTELIVPADVAEELRSAGLRIDAALLEKALHLAGEA